MQQAPSRTLLRALGEYEESLSRVQREYRRLTAAKGPAREAAQRDYERALAHAREIGVRVRAASQAHAA